ncbi:MAG: PIG-L deacetylase family protein [Bacillota bacterium]
MSRVMVFAPHPDDDLIGCGGSIVKHLQCGNTVTVVYLTSGESGSLKYSKTELAQIREAEAVRAATLLGLTDIIFLRNPDGYLEFNRDNLIRITGLIRDKQPNIVYLPHNQDLHKDHLRTNELVLEACNRAVGPWFQECTGEPWSVDTILGYEVWTPLINVSYVEDITPYLEQKIAALRLHESQLQDIQYDEAVRSLNRYRGIMTGKGQYCECFQILKVSELYG